MTKNLYIYFLSLFSFGVSYAQTRIDTLYFSDGKIEEICGFDDKSRIVGDYKVFYPSGILKTEGKYAYKEFLECVNCYETQLIDDIKVYAKLLTTAVGSYKTGIWKEYHPNGQLKSEGRYDELVTAYSGTHLDGKNDHPNNVYLHVEQLKKGIWKYYNEQGKLILTEEYHQGALVYKTEYH